MTTSSAGQQGFYWFMGKVEDINDPHKVGRVRIRVIGIHEDLAVEELPWAHAMAPNTSASFHGIGDSVNLLVGSTVIGFFADGKEKQIPIIMGSLPVIPGMNEDQHSIAELARGKNKFEKGTSYMEPKSPYSAQYTYNRTITTRGGHAIELDDTPGHERVHIYHKSGAYIEINSEGQIVVKAMGDSIDLTEGNKAVYIKGNVTLQVDGNVKSAVKGNVVHSVSGSYELVTSGTINFRSGTGIGFHSSGDVNVKAPGGFNVTDSGIMAVGPIQSAAGITTSFTSPSGSVLQFTKGMLSNATKG